MVYSSNISFLHIDVWFINGMVVRRLFELFLQFFDFIIIISNESSPFGFAAFCSSVPKWLRFMLLLVDGPELPSRQRRQRVIHPAHDSASSSGRILDFQLRKLLQTQSQPG